MKTRKFNVVEYRGKDICYAVYSGTYKECLDFLNKNYDGYPLNEGVWLSRDKDDVNGGGWPFTYEIVRA